MTFTAKKTDKPAQPAPVNQPTREHLPAGHQDATHKSDEDPRHPNDERSDERNAEAMKRANKKPDKADEIVGLGPSNEPIQRNPNTGAMPLPNDRLPEDRDD